MAGQNEEEESNRRGVRLVRECGHQGLYRPQCKDTEGVEQRTSLLQYRKESEGPATVVHSCNPSTLGGQDRQIT